MRLKPMDIGEILDQTFKLYKNNFKTYLAISAVGFLPILIIGLLTFFGILYFGKTSETALIAIIATAVLGMLVAFVVNLASVGATIKVVSQQVLERELDYKQALKYGFKKAWPLFAAGFFMILSVFIGTLFFIIPGVLFYIWFLLFAPVVVLENQGIFKALGRSKALIKGNWWRSLGIQIVMSILVGFLGRIVSIPAQFLLPQIVREDIAVGLFYVISFGVSILLTPLTYIALTLLYFDIRIRKEAYDIEIMAENLQQVSENPVQE